MKNVRLISLIVLLAAASQVLGADWCDVEILPPTPTSSDVVNITLSGWWGDSCVPNASEIYVIGNNIYFDVFLVYPGGGVCAAVVLPWELTEEVGPLSEGTYTVYGRIYGDAYELLTDFVVKDHQTRYVPSQYSTIQAAINDCNDGDTVVVAPGTYFGPGNRDISFMGKAITVRSENPEDPCVVAATVVNCYGSSIQPHRGFIFNSGEGSDSVLDGLTITNGYAVVMCAAGAGIYINGASPTISRCVITNNYAELMEGSLCFCLGGGIYIEYGDGTVISNCIISENSLGEFGWGAGIYCVSSENVKISNCLIYDNTALGYSGRGGGIYCDQDASVEIIGCTIADNSALEGGGIRFVTYESPIRTIDNSVIWGNSSDQIYNPNSTNVLVSYSDIQGGWAGTGNIDADPCFVDADADDFHLIGIGSPCLNAGDPTYVAEPNETDIDGDERVIGGRVDMGADEVSECMNPTAPEYDNWVLLGKPECWCYPRQCQGDADGQPLAPGVPIWVTLADLDILRAAMSKFITDPDFPANGACADFNHQMLYPGVNIPVNLDDLNILRIYINTLDVPCCDNDEDCVLYETDKYNFWTGPTTP